MNSKHLLILVFSLIVTFQCLSQSNMIPSGTYNWKDISSEKNQTVFEGSSDGFEYFKISVVKLSKGKTHVIPPKKLETLVIMKSGKVTQNAGNREAVLGTGSITVMMSKDPLRIRNTGQDEAVFYVMSWRTKDAGKLNYTDYPDVYMIDWDTVQFQETEKGGRRHIIRKPTPMLNEFEMHVTTLNEGVSSHPPHTHLDEEIILVRYGEIEESIDGNLYEGDEGSMMFLRSMVPHGVRNIGKGPCEYYAFRWIPRD